MLNITKKLSISGFTCIAMGIAGDLWAEESYPPQKIPLLPPRDGYQFFGYMGCAASKVEAIAQRERNLFFADNIETPQRYALLRTSFLKRWRGKDQPVVLQLEIREGTKIPSEEYWRDYRLTHPISIVPQYVSFWPALSPEVQRKYDLQVRIHHVVTCHVQRHGGAVCRALDDFKKRICNAMNLKN